MVINDMSNLSSDIILYNKFDINESLSIWHDDILKSVNAKEVNPFETFNLERNSIEMDIEILSKSSEFINSLSSIGLKISQEYNTDDFETFTKLSMKFMFIYNIESDELENPIYIIIQIWDDIKNEWLDCKFFKVNDDIKKFYDKLSNKTIVIKSGEYKYIYTTSNSNEWILQDISTMNDRFKKVLKTSDIEDILRDNNISFEII